MKETIKSERNIHLSVVTLRVIKIFGLESPSFRLGRKVRLFFS